VPHTAIRVLAALSVGCGLYVSGGLLAFADTVAEGPRLGLLPPLWVLPTLTVAAFLVIAKLRVPAERLWPLVFAAILTWPWLPIGVPRAAFVWMGPVALLVWTAIGVAMATASPQGIPRRLHRSLANPRRAPIAALGLALGLYGFTAAQLRAWTPLGDEPHYLVITQSLILDGDLKIENNHRRRDYAAFYPGPLKPDYLRRGADGEIYSIHVPGLPTVLVPAFSLFGLTGATLFLAVVVALGTALAWHLTFLLTGNPGAAWFGWAAVALSTPVVFHASTIYPDGLASALVLIGVAGLMLPGASRNSWLLRGAALALLPWLHLRFSALAGALGAMIVLRLIGRREMREMASFVAIPSVSAAAWFGYFYVLYGIPFPWAPYGGLTQTALTHIPGGLSGLLFDQQAGVVSHAPVYALALVGLVLMSISRDASHAGQHRLGIELSLLSVVYGVAVGSYRMWWGGSSAPGRFMVPVLLALALPLGVLWARGRSSTRAIAMAGLVVSVFVTGVLLVAEHARLVYDSRDGYALWLEWISPIADLARGLPSFHRSPWPVALARVGAWAVAIGCAWLLLRGFEQAARPSHGALGLATMTTLAFATMLALSVVWHDDGDRTEPPQAAQIRMLQQFNPQVRTIGVAYGAEPPARRLELISPELVLQSLRLTSSFRHAPRDHPLLLLSKVPAGTYRINVDPPSAAGRIEIGLGRQAVTIAHLSLPGDLAGPQPHGLVRLPVDVHSMVIRGDGTARREIRRISLTPVELVGPAERRRRGYALQAHRYPTAMAYFMTESAYVEPTGFWIRAASDAELVLEPEGSDQPVTLHARNGPIDNRVSVAVGAWREEHRLAPGEELNIHLPVSRDRLTRVTLHAERGFRPFEIDPDNRDRRSLGCWFAIR
jgi:hypothetical protein